MTGQGDTGPTFLKLDAGDVLVREGEMGEKLDLLLDGVMRVAAGGQGLAEFGPGALEAVSQGHRREDQVAE